MSLNTLANPNLASTDPLCRVVLVEPLIPENTGNVARTCVGTQSQLHLVHPLAFEISDSRVKRAGLDYWEHLSIEQHSSYAAWRNVVDTQGPDRSRVFMIETKGKKSLYEADFRRGDWLVFGKETSGLTDEMLSEFADQTYYIPMDGPTRSLNLSNAVAIGVFELLRQTKKSTL